MLRQMYVLRNRESYKIILIFLKNAFVRVEMCKTFLQWSGYERILNQRSYFVTAVNGKKLF